MLIAGDIGGTKTELAVYSTESGPRVPLARTEVRSDDYSSLRAIVAEFLNDVDVSVDAGSFAVAGPVIAGHVKTTNLPWVLDERALAGDLNLSSIHLMNDVEAVGRSVPVLQNEDLVTLNVGVPVATGSIGVIAPGTGLGESFLTWNGSQYVAHTSEGGHSDFAPTDERQIALLQYLLRRVDHVGVERVCSGMGVPNIYEFLRYEAQIPERRDVTRAIASARDRTRAIIDAATDSDNPSALCRATIDMLVGILATEAGNLFLKVSATGGIYFAGDIARRLVGLLQQPQFIQTFTRKGRFAHLLERVPVHVITRSAALIGAAAYGLEKLGGASSSTLT
jgi:glucokinase